MAEAAHTPTPKTQRLLSAFAVAGDGGMGKLWKSRVCSPDELLVDRL
jgi:hypothetical protein